MNAKRILKKYDVNIHFLYSFLNTCTLLEDLVLFDKQLTYLLVRIGLKYILSTYLLLVKASRIGLSFDLHQLTDVSFP